MLVWEKLGRAFDPTTVTERPWIAAYAQAPAALVLDDALRVYFSCRPPADPQGRYVSYSAYADFARDDPLRLLTVAEKPILDLGEHGAFDEFGVYPVSVIRHAAVLRAYYGGWTRCESVPFNVAIGVAESRDGGRTFERLGPGPILSYSPEEPFVLSGPKIRNFDGMYYLFYIAGRRWIRDGGRHEPVYKIRLATSSDGLQWTKLDRDLVSDALGENEAQASPDVFRHQGRYHMLFCYRHALDYRTNRDRSYRIGYASSGDLVHWSRDDAQAGIEVSAEGWDSQMLAYPHVLNLDGQLYLYYLGNEVGRAGFGVARLVGER